MATIGIPQKINIVTKLYNRERETEEDEHHHGRFLPQMILVSADNIDEVGRSTVEVKNSFLKTRRDVRKWA